MNFSEAVKLCGFENSLSGVRLLAIALI